MTCKNVFLLVIIISSIQIFAQQEIPELITDRPDQTESAAVVPIDSYQIETGISYQNQKFSADGMDQENQNISLLNTLLRYGISSNLEFRVGGGYFSNLNKMGEKNTASRGIGELMIGTKYIFRKDESIITNLGVLCEFLLPFGAEDFRPLKIEPKILVLLQQDLPQNFSLGVNLGGEYSTVEEKYYYDYSASLGFGITDRIGVFAELYGQTSKDSRSANFFDCGITYQQTKTVQLDFSIGSTLESGIEDYFIGFGFSICFIN